MFFQQEKISLDKVRSALKEFEELVTGTQHSGTGVCARKTGLGEGDGDMIGWFFFR